MNTRQIMLQITEDGIQSTFKKYELEKIQFYNHLLFTLVKTFFFKKGKVEYAAMEDMRRKFCFGVSTSQKNTQLGHGQVSLNLITGRMGRGALFVTRNRESFCDF